MDPQFKLWHELTGGARPEKEEPVRRFFEELKTHYAEPARHYHTWKHVQTIIKTLYEYEARKESDFAALYLACLYHDVIYDTRAKDNEEQSARLAESRLNELGMAPEIIARCAELIRATWKHELPDDSFSAALFLDADLLILGAEREIYDWYAGAIRREYEWVPQERYREGRAGVLRRFLDRPKIFFSENIAKEYEAPARRNLTAELKELEGV